MTFYIDLILMDRNLSDSYPLNQFGEPRGNPRRTVKIKL